jgi:DNA-binding CsgD family transcriptional regulator
LDRAILDEIAEATSVEEAAELARLESARCGSVGGTFHVGPPQSSQVGPGVFIGIWGYDDIWMTEYRTYAKRANDVIPDRTMRLALAMTHAEIVREIVMNADEQRTFDHFHAQRMRRTIGIPAYGPFDLDTYMSVTLNRDFTPEDEPLINHLVLVGEVCNRRIGQIMGKQSADQVSLSTRETEVLTWLARGKSNADVATILDVSPATIDTYVRRIFAKLEVYDRISASLKGVRLGLIRL